MASDLEVGRNEGGNGDSVAQTSMAVVKIEIWSWAFPHAWELLAYSFEESRGRKPAPDAEGRNPAPTGTTASSLVPEVPEL